MSASQAFFLLDERIQRFLWDAQWAQLRDVQEKAIPHILAGRQDVIVAASTASGKTEAAFLPALTRLLNDADDGLIVYISPLKALINDQFGRLERLCERLEVPVHAWHGDISASAKQKFMRRPEGVLLITPESLEAHLCLRGTSIAGVFAGTKYIIVDELHAFIGSERGKQLQSLLHRIETVLDRRVPRIGLSATLGDMAAAARFLRTDGSALVVEGVTHGSTLKVLIKGFEEPAPPPGERASDNEGLAARQVAEDVYTHLRGSHNLVFPNSRREVERYTHLLRQICAERGVLDEFWPHHGNLSKTERADSEFALKDKSRPATAICTTTLELGIDIGAVKSVAQIGPPPSVASLRQRLGRSGRREGEPAVLRGYQIEGALDGKSSLATLLRWSTVHAAACVSLLLEKWFEPPKGMGLHLSTLVQQLLSALAQYGGLTAAQAYRLLCAPNAPFTGLSAADFAAFLRHLGETEILLQDHGGLLLPGRVGDQHVNHYSFYAAFATDEEFHLVAGDRELGTLPVEQMLVPGQRIVFGGRTWVVESIDEPRKTIFVSASRGGAPPLFSGGAGRVHTKVRQRMREIYGGTDVLTYLDSTAARFVEEGRSAYRQLELSDSWILSLGDAWLLATWRGDAANEAIACVLRARGLHATTSQLGVEVRREALDATDIEDRIADAAMDAFPDIHSLLAGADNLLRQKWDWALSEELLRASYASLYLDLDEAREWLVAASSSRAGEVETQMHSR